MICDIHCHITYGDYPEFADRLLKRGPFDVDVLLRRLDMEECDRAVLQPLVNPELLDVFGVAGNQECLSAAGKHTDRLLSFVSIDPRSLLNEGDNSLKELLQLYCDLGAAGLGEICAPLAVDDLRYQRLYYWAGEFKLPILFHFQFHQDQGGYGARIAADFNDLERMVKLFPSTRFIGHSYAFWQSLPDGTLARLLRENPNLGADLSGGAAMKIINANSEETIRLFKLYPCQFFFGTDRFSSIDEEIPPILQFMRALKAGNRLSVNEFLTIMGGGYRQ